MTVYTGSCLCGTVQYEATKLEPHMAHCHCSMCRKFHGAAFATFGRVRAGNFRWLAGEEALKSFVASNGTTRKFCGTCGSSLIFVSSQDSGEYVEFTLGTLDSDISERPDAHIYVGSKANWYEIADGLPRFEEGRSQGLSLPPDSGEKK